MANDKYCDNCHYYRPLYTTSGDRCCHYLMWTGKKRPCEAGKDCTVKVPVNVARNRKQREVKSNEKSTD